MILNIIKILLIVIFVFLILVFLLLLLNVKYDIFLKKENKINKVYVSLDYLFGLVKFRCIYFNNFFYNLKIFFIKFSNRNKKEEVVKDKEKIVEKKVPDDDYIFYDRDYILSDKNDVKDLIDNSNKYNHTSFEVKKGKNIIFKNILNTLKDKNTIKLLLDSLKNLFAIIKPKKLDANFCYGILNPVYVGALFGLSGIMKSVVDSNVKLNPVIGINKFDYDVKMEGKISLLKLVVIITKLFLNKNIRNIIFS